MKIFQEDKRKGRMVSIITVIIILCIIGGSMLFFEMRILKMSEGMKDQEGRQYDRYYAMIVGDSGELFWENVYQGAREEGKNAGAYVEEFGSGLFDAYTREELMKIAIASEVDGIILEAEENDEMTGLIDEAVEKGIPVVTVLSDNMNSKRQSFVGIGSYNLGREYGKRIVKLANYDKHRIMILANTSMGTYAQNLILSSIQDTIQQEKTPGQRLEVTIKTLENYGDFSTEESIRNIFMGAEEMPEILVCLDEVSTLCAYQAVVDYNMVGKLAIIGYYDSDSILQAIERNVVNATVSVDARQMGRYCVEALREYEETGYVSEYFEADTFLITISNVKEYMREETNEEK